MTPSFIVDRLQRADPPGSLGLMQSMRRSAGTGNDLHGQLPTFIFIFFRST